MRKERGRARRPGSTHTRTSEAEQLVAFRSVMLTVEPKKAYTTPPYCHSVARVGGGENRDGRGKHREEKWPTQKARAHNGEKRT